MEKGRKRRTEKLELVYFKGSFKEKYILEFFIF
jgi:hypothetical protein